MHALIPRYIDKTLVQVRYTQQKWARIPWTYISKATPAGRPGREGKHKERKCQKVKLIHNA
jgi:hypothetical protein